MYVHACEKYEWVHARLLVQISLSGEKLKITHFCIICKTREMFACYSLKFNV